MPKIAVERKSAAISLSLFVCQHVAQAKILAQSADIAQPRPLGVIGRDSAGGTLEPSKAVRMAARTEACMIDECFERSDVIEEIHAFVIDYNGVPCPNLSRLDEVTFARSRRY